VAIFYSFVVDDCVCSLTGAVKEWTFLPQAIGPGGPCGCGTGVGMSSGAGVPGGSGISGGTGSVLPGAGGTAGTSRGVSAAYNVMVKISFWECRKTNARLSAGIRLQEIKD